MSYKTRILNSLMVLALATFTPLVLAQEQPKEHPKGEHPKEHPTPGKATGLTKDELADAITAWVESESKKSGGKLEVKDPVEDKTLRLTLVKVHREKLSTVAHARYFACADFAAEDGTTYDLDIFMKGADKDHIRMTEVTVHKKNGKERYTWYEEGGVWKKKPVE